MSEPREPRQERGQRRVNQILDAAAALIAEVEPEGVTVQALAARAGASKGSMYHFFADRESVFLALADRHVRGLDAWLADARAERTEAVARGTVDEAVEAFVAPLHAYGDQHPDLARLMAEPATLTRLAAQRTALYDEVEDYAAWIVRQRNPALPAGRVATIAAVMLAVHGALRGERVVAAAGSLASARAEARRALRAYLQSYEAG